MIKSFSDRKICWNSDWVLQGSFSVNSQVPQMLLMFYRDVSGVELLMNNHQSLKAEVDAREDNFNVCVSLGKELLARNHYATPEIKEKLMSLSNQRINMLQRWEERWEHLQLSKSHQQFDLYCYWI